MKKYEIVLTEKNASLMYSGRFIEYHKVSDLSAKMNGKPVSLLLIEEDGEKYYSFPTIKLEGNGKVNKIKLTFTLTRLLNYSKLIMAPLLFNVNKFAPIMHFPIAPIPVEKGKESDIVTVRIDLDSLFYRISPVGSGWTAMYLPPRNEWNKYPVENGAVLLPSFEYPILQEFNFGDNVVIIKTRFSEENVADRFTLIFTPKYPFFIIPLTFLYGAYLPFIGKQLKRKSERSSFIRKVVFGYTLPLLAMGIGSVKDLDFVYLFSKELLKLTNPLFVALTFLYPLAYPFMVSLLQRKKRIS